MPDLDLVVFDLGRVLLRIVDDFDHACRLVGIDTLPGMSGDLSIHAKRASDPRAAELFSAYETGRISTRDYLPQAASITGSDPETMLRLLDACVIEAFDGTADLLAELADQPVKTACLSNTNARHWDLISDPSHPAFIELSLLDYPLGSHLIGHAKPDPSAYARLEEVCGVSSDRVLFFDDIPENVGAAHARGWQAVLVERQDDPIPGVRSVLSDYGAL